MEILLQKAAAAQADVQVHFKGKTAFLVLNAGKDFTFDEARIAKVHQALDQISESEEANVLVTISTSQKSFSTGFSLGYWREHETHAFKCIS